LAGSFRVAANVRPRLHKMSFCPAERPESESALLQRAADWKEHQSLEFLDAKTLSQITRDEGIDFATALLFDRFQNSSRHVEFIRRIDSLRTSSPAPPGKIRARVVIVPGALYVERPEMGGDGRIVRQVAESLGYETELIPIVSFGSVTKNASLIVEWLKEHSEEQFIFVSLSKGGADFKIALASADGAELFSNVIAWINVCGPLNGSRMADWVMAGRVRTFFCRLKFFFQKRDFRFITELCRDRTKVLSSTFHPPPSLRIINLIGFPLAGHTTTRFSRFCHRILAEWGPNDGTTSLSDVSAWPGDVYPAWGADHYFRPDSLAQSLISSILSYLSEEVATIPERKQVL
jgi:hypothetical protein